MTKSNLFPTPAESTTLPAELLQTLLESNTPLTNLRIERILSPPNHASEPGSWYDQPDTEWVLLLEGQATLSFTGPDKQIDLTPGDHLLIPPHRKHRIDRTHPTEPTLWLAIHWQ